MVISEVGNMDELLVMTEVVGAMLEIELKPGRIGFYEVHSNDFKKMFV